MSNTYQLSIILKKLKLLSFLLSLFSLKNLYKTKVEKALNQIMFDLMLLMISNMSNSNGASPPHVLYDSL